MQIKKAGVVAAGALATVAVMGAPAAAAPAPQADASAFTKASALNMARGGWFKPWDAQPQALVATGTGSKDSVAAWQTCGSVASTGAGGVVDGDDNTLIGDNGIACNNANAVLDTEIVPGITGTLNDTATLVAPWQFCGSTVTSGVGVVTAVQAQNTVFGACRNANVVITGPESNGNNRYTESMILEQGKPLDRQAGKQTVTVASQGASRAVNVAQPADKARTSQYTKSDTKSDTKANVQVSAANVQVGTAASSAKAGWGGGSWGVDSFGQAPMGVLSTSTGAALITTPWQVCGGQTTAGTGASIGTLSPNTIFGGCDNGNVWIDQPEWWQHLTSVGDYSHISVTAIQVCGSDANTGVGVGTSVTSSDTVFGTCNNDNTVIR